MGIVIKDCSSDIRELRELLTPIKNQDEMFKAFADYAMLKHGIGSFRTESGKMYLDNLRVNMSINSLLEFMGL